MILGMIPNHKITISSSGTFCIHTNFLYSISLGGFSLILRKRNETSWETNKRRETRGKKGTPYYIPVLEWGVLHLKITLFFWYERKSSKKTEVLTGLAGSLPQFCPPGGQRREPSCRFRFPFKKKEIFSWTFLDDISICSYEEQCETILSVWYLTSI